MGGTIGRGVVLFCTLVWIPSIARADQEPPPPAQPPARRVVETQPQLFDERYYVIPETDLSSRPPVNQQAPNYNGDLFETVPVPEPILKRLEQHSDFVQPFLDPAVFPEISGRVLSLGGYAPRNNSGEFDQLMYVSLYFFDFYAPLLTIRDNTPFSLDRFRMDLKLPLLFGNNAVTLYLGGNVPIGTWTNGGGVNFMVGYAIGARGVSFQVRLGGGFDQLIGETDTPLASSFMGETALSVDLARHVQLLVEVDGRKLVGQPGGTLRAFPGIRISPLDLKTLSFAVGALWTADSFNADGHYVGGLGTRRAGAYFDAGYVFF